jgi:putative NADPH-quinone reductase
MLKGWIDRVWVRGVAFELPPKAGRIRPLLSNIRRIAVVTTHGSSKLINSLQGESGKRIAFRSIRVLCHRFVRTKWIALYGVDACSDSERRAFVERAGREVTRFVSG